MADSKTDKMRKLFADKQVDAEQLEGVAGGSKYQVADDSRFLNVLLRGHPDQCDRYGETRAGSFYEGNQIGREVTKAWAAVGITCNASIGAINSYKDAKTGQSITRDQALALAQQRVGKTLKESDWYWE